MPARTSSQGSKRWQPPIQPRRDRRRDTGPGPAAYTLDLPWGERETRGAGRWGRANKSQAARSFYYGAGPNQASSMYGADSPGPVYGTMCDPGASFSGPRAAGNAPCRGHRASASCCCWLAGWWSPSRLCGWPQAGWCRMVSRQGGRFSGRCSRRPHPPVS